MFASFLPVTLSVPFVHFVLPSFFSAAVSFTSKYWQWKSQQPGLGSFHCWDGCKLQLWPWLQPPGRGIDSLHWLRKLEPSSSSVCRYTPRWELWIVWEFPPLKACRIHPFPWIHQSFPFVLPVNIYLQMYILTIRFHTIYVVAIPISPCVFFPDRWLWPTSKLNLCWAHWGIQEPDGIPCWGHCAIPLPTGIQETPRSIPNSDMPPKPHVVWSARVL